MWRSIKKAARWVAAPVTSIGLVIWAGLTGDVGAPVDLPDPISDFPATYLALGDSYSAGEGLELYLPGTQDLVDGGNRCHRSDRAYAMVLDAVQSTDIVFRACSGAKSIEVLVEDQMHGDDDNQTSTGGPQVTDPPQEALLVTMSIGGNDVGFADVIKFCALRFGCLDDEYRDGETLQEWADRRLDELEVDLQQLYAELAMSFPDRILVVGYPQLFALDPSPTIRKCQAEYKVAFSNSERHGLRSLVADLNERIRSTALAAGLEFVATADAFAGHETCGEDGFWINFLPEGALAAIVDFQVHPSNFHPTEDGQRMLARLVSCYLRINPDGSVGSVTHATDFGAQGDEVHACATGSAS